MLTASGQPYELVTVQSRGRSLKVFRNGPGTLRELFERTVSDRPFLVYGEDRHTFREAWDAAARLAHLLTTRYGVGKGDRVAIAMRNYPEWVLGYTAATSIGAIAVAMNALWQSDEMGYALDDSGAKVLLADQERIDRLARLGRPVTAAVLAVRPGAPDTGYPDLAALLAEVGEVPMPAADVAPEDPATLFYTSGTSGRPKGVLSSHRAVVSALLSWEVDLQAAALEAGIEIPEPAVQPSALLAVPLFHVTGSNAVWLSSYRAQRRMVCMHRWDPALALELVEREGITSFTATPAMTGDLIRAARAAGKDLGTLQGVGGGGAAREPDQVRQIDDVFAQALPNTGWGMTETNAIGAGIIGPDYLAHPESSGRCSPVMELRIVAPDGTVLGAGERGELQVRGTSLCEGYWNRPEADAESFTSDGWFRSGDLAYIDGEGYLCIVDRIKDLIIRGGENIGCAHVEAALLRYPGVHEAAVYAVPDERLGEEVGATVHGDRALDFDELREFLGQHLARFEIPRYFRLADEPLPRTASGKILKRALRDDAVAALATSAITEP